MTYFEFIPRSFAFSPAFDSHREKNEEHNCYGETIANAEVPPEVNIVEELDDYPS